MGISINKKNKKKLSLSSVKSIFIKIIWPRRIQLFIGLGIISINRSVGLTLPVSTKFLIDDVFVVGDTKMFNLILMAVGIAVIIQSISSYVLTRLLSVESHHLVVEMRSQIQRHIIHLPVRFFNTHKSGELVSRIMSDPAGVKFLIGTGSIQLVGGALTMIFSFLILFYLNRPMTLIALFFLVIFGAISVKAFTYIRPIFKRRDEIKAEVTGRLTESLNGIRIIKGFDTEHREEKIFHDDIVRLFNNIKKSLIAMSLVTSIATLMMGLVSIAVFYYGGNEIIDGEMTSGDFVSFTLLLGFLVAPVVQMSNIGTQMTEVFAGLDRMDEIFELNREDVDEQRTISIGKIKGRVEYEGVSYSYDKEKKVIEDVSLLADCGTVNALVGSSGSGKSTLSNLVASFLTPDTGRIMVDGIDLSQIKLKDYRKQLGVVFQDDFLFDGSIRENILYARPDATEEQLRQVVEFANVHRFTDDFKKGLDTIIGERGVMLSGGQRQRVSIARALLADPRILILDEATSNLDAESEKLIQKSLNILMKGRTTFVIAHRLSTIKNADQILVLEKGKIVERGTHEELINKRSRYFELYTYQTKI